MAQRPRPRRRQLLRLVLVKRNTSLVGRATSKHENRTEAVGLLEQPPRSCARPRPAHPPKKSAPWEQARLFPRPRSGSADGDGGGELGYLGRRPLHGDSDRWDPGQSLATSPLCRGGELPSSVTRTRGAGFRRRAGVGGRLRRPLRGAAREVARNSVGTFSCFCPRLRIAWTAPAPGQPAQNRLRTQRP